MVRWYLYNCSLMFTGDAHTSGAQPTLKFRGHHLSCLVCLDDLPVLVRRALSVSNILRWKGYIYAPPTVVAGVRISGRTHSRLGPLV